MVFLAVFLLTGAAGRLSAQAYQEAPGLARAFEKRGLTGCFAVLDPAKNVIHILNQKRAQTRFQPASTFKIANALIGLEVGAVRDLDEVLPYGGTRERLKQWEQDMNLKDAMKVSNVAVFHQLAKRIGQERMQSWLERLRYGNAQAGPTAGTRFWLEGPLAISPLEQVDFLKRLSGGELPVKPQVCQDVRKLIFQEKKGDRTLYAKTGWVGPQKPQVGWWVGWVEHQGLNYPFALNIEIRTDADAKERVPVALECLKTLGIW